MMSKIRDLGALAAIVLIVLLAGRAEAAPQILGLVASNGMPTPLTCRDGLCTGELASFCLQEAREAPDSGQEYRLAPGGGFTLIVRLADGPTLRLPARDLLAIKARLGFTNVDISLPEAKLAALDIHLPQARLAALDIHLPEAKLAALDIRARQAQSLAIEVAPETTILPVAAPGDPDPQSPEDIADAVGPLRHLAAETFDRPGEIPDAARLIGLLINTLPAGPARRPVVLDALFRQVVTGVAPHRLGEEAIAEAETIAQSCRRSVETPSSTALSDCLELRQFTLMSILNGRFWAAAGS